MANQYWCKVKQTGYADGYIMLRLREHGGQFERYYTAPDAVKREMLSIGLTAISTGYMVRADLDSTDEYSPIVRLLLLDQ
jgi:hypothetical protein